MRRLLKLASAIAFLAGLLTVSALAAEGDYIFTLIDEPSSQALTIAAQTEEIYAPQGVYMTADKSIVQLLQDMGQIKSVCIDHALENPDIDLPVPVAEEGLALSGTQTDYWVFDLVNAQYAFNNNITGSGVVVGVIDTGLAQNFCDYTDATILTGYDCTVSDTDPAWRDTTDEKGHGTMVSSVICEKEYGIASAISLVPFKCYSSNSNSGTFSTVARALYLAADYPCDVINMSVASTSSNETLKSACEYASNAGVILIAAAGNRSTLLDVTSPRIPASYDCVISVSNVDSDGTLSYSSVRNSTVAVAAPGDDITALSTGYTYTQTSGTSFSSPLVAGIAALALSVYPEMTQSVFLSYIQETSTDKGTEGKDNEYGWGIINTEELLKAAQKDQEAYGLSGDAILSRIDSKTGTVSVYVPASQSRQLVFVAFFNNKGKLVGLEQYSCESGEYLRQKGIEYAPFAVSICIWSLSDADYLLNSGYTASLTS